MRFLLILALLLAAMAGAACRGTPTEVRQRIAWFHERANAGRFDEITREEALSQTFDKYMRPRTELGRMIRSTEAMVEDISGDFRVVTVRQNTDFERGHAVETFSFRIDDHGLRLSSYTYQIGKRVWCPTITLSLTQCEIEDAPATLNAAR